jgi:hypothetical protein
MIVLLLVRRLKESEQKAFNDSLTSKAQLGKLEEEKLKLVRETQDLQKNVTELTAVNNKLISHNNLRQKIQHHVKIKEENNQLRKASQAFWIDHAHA